jgi:uncharacterized protein YigA (DUF484 family)
MLNKKFRHSLTECLVIIFGLIFFFQPLLTNAQNSAEKGLPFVTNYSPKTFKAYPQIFSEIQDDNGLMYFGNQNYILQYDGVIWRKIDCSNGGQVAVRAMAKNRKGLIYYGAIGNFGYLSADSSTGQMKASSLLKYIPDSLRAFNDIWSVYVTDRGVYFQARERIFRLQEDSSGKIVGELKAWEPKTRFMYAFYLDGVYYVHQQALGLFKMVNDSLELIPGSEFLGSERMQVMLPYDENKNEKKYLLGMFYSGCYLFDGKQFTKFTIQADSLLSSTLYRGAVLQGGNYALALAGKGLLVIDKAGRTLNLINRATGLQDESVYSVYPDRQGNVWLGLDNGISKIETGSPLTQFGVQSGITTAVLSVCRFDGVIYVGTTNGMRRLNETTGNFDPIKEIATNQVFTLQPDNDQLLVATDGLFSIKDNNVHLLRPSVSGNLQIAALFIPKDRPDLLFTGDALQGTLVFGRRSQTKDNNATWQYLGAIAGINQQVWTFAQDNKGTLWVGTQSEAAYRLKLAFDDKGVIDLPKCVAEKFARNNGLPAGGGPVFPVHGEVLFAADSGIYKFDPAIKQFAVDKRFGTFPNAGGRDESILVEDYAGRVWIRLGKESEIAIPQPDGSYRIDKTSLLPIAERTISYFYPERSGAVWICTTDGLVRFDEHLKKDYDQPYKTLLRNVAAGKHVLNPDAYQDGQSSMSLASTDNSLRFEYSAPFFEQEDKTKYQTWLEGFDKGWSDWGTNSYKEYTNLPHGDYKFHVRAMNVYQKVSEEEVYGFTINPPWFQTWWAYLLYALVAIGIVYLVVRYRTKQLHEKHRELEKIVSDRTGELSQRVQELAVINSVQEALVSALDMQEIYELVGERIRKVFDAQAVVIATFDHAAGTENFQYGIENGERFYHASRPLDKLRKHLISTRQKIVIKTSEEGFSWFGGTALPGTKPLRSGVFVPLTIGDKITSYVSLQNVDRENAFSDSDIRLLETLANSMSVALENARLFDETQRLLKETEQRNAELAVINSVQDGLASKLDIQAIYDLVGDKIRDVFDAQAVGIVTLDKKTGTEKFVYMIEKGERYYPDPRPYDKLREQLIRTKKKILINNNIEAAFAEFGLKVIKGSEMPKSLLFVPLIANDE